MNIYIIRCIHLKFVNNTTRAIGRGSFLEDDHPEDREALRLYYVRLLSLAGYK